MKKLIYLTKVLLGLSIIFLISSCSKENDLSLKSTDSNIVYFDEAREFAKAFFENNNEGNVSLRSDWQGESTTFNGADDLPGVHVFNHSEGDEESFVIVSGDNRIAPILAYGDDDFPLDYLPFGVAEWLDKQIKFIDEIRTTDLTQSKGIADTWQAKKIPLEEESGCCEECPNYPDCLENPLIGCGANSNVLCDGITDDNPCGNNTYYQYGPLLDTEWGQGCVYNELCPAEPILPWPWNGPMCGGNLPCDHFYTGCVATAMTQVINYFEHPSSYNYASLLPKYNSWNFGSSGAGEVAQLMIDAAESVDMNWGCDGSGASGGDIDNALEDDFGYADGGNFDNYGSSGPVKQNIRWGKPVIFTGCNDGISLFDWTYSECHAWVCDGYKGYSNFCYSYLFYSMNWGWNGSYNGWYGVSNWAPGNYDFQYKRKVLLNINP